MINPRLSRLVDRLRSFARVAPSRRDILSLADKIEESAGGAECVLPGETVELEGVQAITRLEYLAGQVIGPLLAHHLAAGAFTPVAHHQVADMAVAIAVGLEAALDERYRDRADQAAYDLEQAEGASDARA